MSPPALRELGLQTCAKGMLCFSHMQMTLKPSNDAGRVSLSEEWDSPEGGGAGMVLFGMVRQFGQIAPSLLHSLRIMPQLYML